MPPSKTTLTISGLQVHIYGLTEAKASKYPTVDVVFLLHGRTRTYLDNEAWAFKTLELDYARPTPQRVGRGLIAVSFDQRNHGHRRTSMLANLSWGEGNETHAQDMYAVQCGTADDVSFLITFLPSFLFPQGQAKFQHIICAGVSLGGHATYLALSHDPRITAGIAIIGCPSYASLILSRARESGVDIESKVPTSFLALVAEHDPKLEVLSRKDVLILKGDEDPLVPWSASEEFAGNLVAGGRSQVVGYPGVGHEFTEEMLEKSGAWIVEWRRGR